MSVNNVVADEQWNTQPRLFDRQPLHFMHVVRADDIEQIPDGAAFDCRGGIAGNGGAGHGLAAGRHGELTEFFGQRHSADQTFDASHGTFAPSRVVW